MTASSSFSQLRIAADPLLDPMLLAGIAILLVLLFLVHLWQNGRVALWRALAGSVLLGLLCNPALVREHRERTPDVALIVADRSPSQMIGDRSKMTDDALAWLRQNLSNRPDLELRVRETNGSAQLPVTQTALFETADEALADIPLNRRAGIIFISDGRIADVPAALPAEHEPVHLLLTGHKADHDLQIRLLKAPTYGLIGETLSLRFRIDDAGRQAGRDIPVTLRLPDGTVREEIIPTGEETEWALPLPYAGQNVFEMSIPGDQQELTALNNRAVFSVTGVRDRLRVLLVSGEPHSGGRTWRDLLKSDSGVDLVHFTILRNPDSQDFTPQSELSLIAFPMRELFEIKLKEFDLVVLDRFRLNAIMPDIYFQNMRDYVQNGGALLEVSGPSFATEESLYHTALGSIFPTRPDGQAVAEPFSPTLTDLGKIHPVTQTIAQNSAWGNWLQFVPVAKIQGDVLMEAPGGRPLLVLNHAGEGRIAQLASDQIWLWSRGYDGGGPTEELLRRIVHWLMKEPELEEDALDARADKDSITVRRRQLERETSPVTMTMPDGSKKDIPLLPRENGWLSATVTASQQSIYEFSSGEHRRIVAYGDSNAPEMRDLIASADPLRPVLDATKGAVIRLDDIPEPDIKRLDPGRDYGGRGWIGLRRNNATVVTGTEQSPLFPPWFSLMLPLFLLALAWWREGRKT